MLTPKQAAEIAAQNASGSEEPANPFVTSIEMMLDTRLVQQGSAALSCSGAPPQGALVAAPAVIMEIERRYRAAGWKSTIVGGTVVIVAPPERWEGALSSRRVGGWRCGACGTMNIDGVRCLVCRTARA